MTRVLIDLISDNEAAWVAQKRKTIGSGDIATIIGANRFCTPLKLWAIKTGREAPDPENDGMWLGKQMEPIVAKIAARKLGLKIRYADTLFGHDDIPWATATPDYFAYSNPADSSILECKNVSWRMRHDWDGKAPLGPQSQVIWQCGVTGIKNAILAPLIGGDMESFEPYLVEYDQRLFEQIVDLAEKFHWNVVNDTPPAPTAGDTKLLERIIGDLESKVVELPEQFQAELASWVSENEFHKVKNAEAAVAKERMDQIKNRLRIVMGNADQAICGRYQIKVKEVIKKPYTTKLSKYNLFTVKDGRSENDG